MAFELRPGCDLAEEIRRIGVEQTGRAIAELSKPGDPHRAIHEARKSLKRTRALLHFARAGLSRGDFAKNDRRIRNLARPLSGTRDCQAMVEILAKLERRFGADWSSTLVGGLRATFHGRQQRGEIALTRLIEEAVEQTGKMQGRFQGLKLDRKKLSIGAGVQPTYARAQRGLRRAYELGEGDAFHAWRKDAQRHWRQMQLLAAAWPEEMAVQTAKARALSYCLGDDHDIHIILGHVRIIGPNLAPWSEMETFYDGCIEQQLGLRMAARNHARLLLAERPTAFGRRLSCYWRAASERFGHGAHFSATLDRDSKVVPIQSARLKDMRDAPPVIVRD